MFSLEDLRTFSKIGGALWLDIETSEQSALETITAVSLLDLTPERALEKALTALLEKAKRKPVPPSPFQADLLLTRFYRLTPEERLILVALYYGGGGWSYARLSKILGMPGEEVEKLAWNARLQLCVGMPYPAGPSILGAHCPQYHSTHPWTQGFLDDEITSARDRLFLQNHLFVCDSCRDALSRCRHLTFKIEQDISKILEPADFSEALEAICRNSYLLKHPSQMGLKQSLGLFIQRTEVRWALLVLGVLCLMKIIH